MAVHFLKTAILSRCKVKEKTLLIAIFLSWGTSRIYRNLIPKLMQIQNNIKILPLQGAFYLTIILKYTRQVCHNTNFKVFRLTLIALPLVGTSGNQLMLI